MRLIFIFIIFAFFPFKDLRSKGFNVIRDAEIENFLSDISKVLLDESDLNSDKLQFYIDNKNYINASVIPGPRFFFTTELLIKVKTLDQIAGVIAHELGHVVGGHFAKINQAYKDSSLITILSSLLAVGAIAGGAPEAGNALILGGQHLSQANLLSFSRSQESYADQTSIRLLLKSGFSLNGLLDMFKLLEQNEKFKQFNPYFLTHPLSSKRKRNIKMHLGSQKFVNSFEDLEKRFRLIKAKLYGFFLKQDALDKIYKNTSSLESNYAYSLRYYRIGKVDLAIEEINKCLKVDPNNPYFRELKGQIFYENGNILLAINEFRKALELFPSEKSFELFLAKALYNKKNEVDYKEAINLLWSYIKKDEFSVDAWHYLGLNYGKIKKFDYASYAFAEKFLLINQIKNAKIHIAKVRKGSKDPFILNKIGDLEYEINKREKKE